MQIFRDITALQAWSTHAFRNNTNIGLVPTMGYLHAGHLSLVQAARQRAALVVLSIFVNPTQFGPLEDLATYPRNEERDLHLCREAGVDVVFLPSANAMYHEDASIFVDENALSRGLCGAQRAGHFRGVCTVLAKLFNIAHPQVAIFGQKDYQQAAITKRLVRDLNFPLEIVVAPIVREADGLALSSRNSYLTPEERQRALGLYRALQKASALYQAGTRQTRTLQEQMTAILHQHDLTPEYVTVVDGATLKPLTAALPGSVALLAARCGKTRLIDNLIF